MKQAKQKKRGQIDPIFKQVLVNKLTEFAVELQTEVEVSRLPRTMDALVIVPAKKAQQQLANQTSFAYFRQYNHVEFKGRRDPLTIKGFHLIQGRTHLFLGEQTISAADMKRISYPNCCSAIVNDRFMNLAPVEHPPSSL